MDKSAILDNAQLFASRGQFEKAIAEWKKLTTGTPADGSIYNTIGDLHLKRNAPADAIEAYFQAAAAFRSGDGGPKAIALYKKILKIDPTRHEAYRGLGELNAERGFTSSAVSDYLALCRLYQKAGKIQEALDVYRVIVKLDPSNAEACQRIAELSPGEAPSLQPQVQPKPDDSLPQRPAEASEAPRSDLKPTAVAHEAQQPVRPTGRPSPGTLPGHQEKSRQEFLAEATKLMNDGRFTEAEPLLMELLSNEPGDPEVCRHLAALHLRCGQMEGAKAEFQFLAEAAMRVQDYALAESMLHEYLRADPQCVQLRELLGRVYELRGDGLSAAVQYGAALETLLQCPDPEQPTLPAELYHKIKTVAPLSPLLSQFAPAVESLPAQEAAQIDEGPGHQDDAGPEAGVRLEDLGVIASPHAAALEFAKAPDDGEEDGQGNQGTLDHEAAGAGARMAPDEPSSATRKTSVFKFAVVSDVAPSEEKGSAEAGREGARGQGSLGNVAARDKPAFRFVSAADRTDESEAGPRLPQPGPADETQTDETCGEYFNRALAYKERGLLTEAIQEFRRACEGERYFIDSSRMLASCLSDQGLNGPAIEYLEQVLTDPRCEGAESTPVRYELGLLYEAEGFFDRARWVFETILSFRDAADRLERIRSSRSGASSTGSVSPGGAGDPVPSAVGPVPTKETATADQRKRRISYL